MNTTEGPIERDPRRIRPPYDVPDTAFDHLRRTNPDAWRVAVRATWHWLRRPSGRHHLKRSTHHTWQLR